MANAEDWRFARVLDDDFDRMNSDRFLERYFELMDDVPPSLRDRQLNHIRTAPGRALQWVEALKLKSNHAEPILDLGCGPGGFLLASPELVAERPVWGLDIALRWLLVARKRLDEAGVRGVRLVCGCSESLPFPDARFAGIVAGDLIEHVSDQARTLTEAHRVLRPGSRIVLTTPNRYSLTPEPHVGVWGVGYLPRRLMNPYVRLVSRREFRAIVTRGRRDWRRLLRRSPFRAGCVEAPQLPKAELARFGSWKVALARTYNILVATKVGQALAGVVGPLFQIVARRPPDPADPLTEAPGPQQC